MNEQRITRLVVGGVLAIVSLLAVIWFFNNFELAEREISSGYSQEARRNPLLAAERFLTRLGRRAASVSSTDLWRALPATDDVLVIYRFSPPAGEARQQALWDWIEAGGHLIVEADETLFEDKKGKAPNTFLAELGVRLHRSEVDSLDDDADEALSKIEFADYPEPVSVYFAPYRYMTDAEESASAAVACGEGYCLLQYDVGEGRVTVLSDNDFLSNHSIGEHEHALAFALLTDNGGVGQVWLVHDVVMPSLLTLIWRHGAYAVSAALVLLLLWMWSLSARLGPLLPPLASPRRDIGEHLAASATFLWRQDGGQQLFRSNQQRIEQAWVGKHYVLRGMDRAARCQWIAARSGLSARAVELALYGEYAADRDFIEMSSYLQVLATTL